MALKVGITGGIGSGKTMICSVFRELGIPVYHADDEAKKLYSLEHSVKQCMLTRFGSKIYTETGEINRTMLAGVIFNDPYALDFINKLIHPLIETYYKLWHEQQKSVPYTLIEAALLIESGMNEKTDRLITVSAPEELRINRVISRDGTDLKSVRLRMSKQTSDEYKIHKSDYVIFNDEKQPVLPQVLAIHEQLTGSKM